MQEPFRNKKSRGYRLRPASGRDRLDSRVRRLCSRLSILAVVVAAAIVIRSLYNIQIIHGAESGVALIRENRERFKFSSITSRRKVIKREPIQASR